MTQQMAIYHGSDHIIAQPIWGYGNPRNDYGLGFYCTESLELAKEWGASDEADGVANEYLLKTDGLKILNLNGGDYCILHWLAVLLENRTFRVSGDIAPLAKSFIREHFGIDYKNVDIIRGYRADDSSFSFANAFLNNALTLERLEQAMTLGNLGEQIVLRSKRAFSSLTFKGVHPAQRDVYYPRKLARDNEARSIYRSELRVSDLTHSPTILTIMQDDWRPNDARLRRIVFE